MGGGYTKYEDEGRTIIIIIKRTRFDIYEGGIHVPRNVT
jgi:hypothetical protein